METTSSSSNLQNLTLQLEEINILQAMFPGEKELVWDDPSLLIDLEEFVNSNGMAFQYCRFVSFSLNLDLSVSELDVDNKIPICLSITLPTSYPDVYPDVSIMSNELVRKKQSQINQDLAQYMSTLDLGEVVLLNLITWIQENIDHYYDAISRTHEVECKREVEGDDESGLWLYMHHIYNKEKRKNIINWAEELSLTGFSLPGKPGVVYVEGDTRNVDDYFERLRRLAWKRMSCKVKEKCTKRIFSDFQELCFEVHGGRDYHMDLGKFFQFLKANGIEYMFKELFGIEGNG